MNLNLTHALLGAATQQSNGMFKVRDPRLIREVELMTKAGLVESSLQSIDGEMVAVIEGVTDSGHQFLSAFKHKPPPKIASILSAKTLIGKD